MSQQTPKHQCPKCGRVPMEVRVYPNPKTTFVLYIHSKVKRAFFIETEGCIVDKDEHYKAINGNPDPDRDDPPAATMRSWLDDEISAMEVI